MTASWARRAGGYLVDALRGVREAPIEMVATATVAATFSWALESQGSGTAFRAWWEIAVPCALVLVIAWTGTLLHAMGRWDATRRWAFTLAGALAVAIYAWTVVDFRYESEAWRAGLLLAAAVAWLVALPAFGGRGRGEAGGERIGRMRRVGERFALRAIGAVLYGAVLFAGLALALAAVDNLFELGLEEQIYGHVWGWIAFVLIPWIVLGGLDDYVLAADRAEADAIPATWSGVSSVAYRIILWLVPPLLALYTLILYAYAARILVTGELPKNLVSPMVLAAGGLAALALILFDPRPGRGGLARGLRLAPALFLPLAPVGYRALLLRVDQYGWTEFRVVRVVVLSALAALAIGATVQLVRRRAFSLHAAPLVLAAVFLLSAVGPWSALAISRDSQQERLAAALTEVGVPPGATSVRAADRPPTGAGPDSAHTVPAATYERIRDSARYLSSHFGREALPGGVAGFAHDHPGSVDYAAQLGLRPDALPAREGLSVGGTLSRGAPLRLEGGLAYRVEWTRGPRGEERPGGAVEPAGRSPMTVAVRDGQRLELSVGSALLTADLGPLIRELERTADPREPGRLPPDRAVVPLVGGSGARAGELVVWQIWAQADSAGWRLQRVEALAVVGAN